MAALGSVAGVHVPLVLMKRDDFGYLVLGMDAKSTF